MTMASSNKAAPDFDEDDDLELLRLAALKSLKPKTTTEIQNKSGSSHFAPQYNKTSTFGAAQTTRHHNRGFRNNPARGCRNGINSRIRTNTNLIPIQTIDSDEPKQLPLALKKPPSETPKLILPQDRYHNPQISENTLKENCGNKFDRYDNSDESESDSDETPAKPIKRERKTSVDTLMDELDNEINLLEAKIEPKIEERLSDNEEAMSVIEEAPVVNETLVISELDTNLSPDEPISPEMLPKIEESPVLLKKSKSPSPFLNKYPKRRRSNTRSRSRSPPYRSRSRSPRSRSPRSRSPRSRSPPRKMRYSPNHYPRALSPLALNAEVLTSITMAPLSPRSAAFVLENRQILARRMSPRRSLSRESRSRSPTPKRNMSPRRRSRSISPRRRSVSPRRNLPLYRYPKRGSNSPVINRRGSNSPVSNKPIHKRLGSRNVSPYLERKAETVKRKRSSRSISLSLSPSPSRNYHKRPLNETTGHLNTEAKNRRDKIRKEKVRDEKSRKESPKLETIPKDDPILEARRRKFESPVQINNGIIKLKPSKPEEDKDESETIEGEQEKVETTPEQNDSDEILEEPDEILDLNPVLDDLWSEEESDDENEGRFKSKPSSEKTNVPISFRKITERPIPKSLHPRDNIERDRKNKRQRRRRSRSPLKSTNKPEPKRDSENKIREDINSKSKLDVKSIEVEKKKEKSKATLKSDSKNLDILKILHSEQNMKRKVRIQEIAELAKANVENADISEAAEKQSDITKKEDDGGDLRAELSRRRAQRLIKAGSLAEALPTRLLKNALQEVVPKRAAEKQTKLSKGNSSSVDRKVLIVKSLASSTPASQLEPTNKVGNREGKLPIHMRLGSNPDLEEPVRLERRNKSGRRSSRRKKPVQV